MARAAVAFDAAQQRPRFLFADAVLLEAADWRGVLRSWWDGLAVGGHLILWVPDCRHCSGDTVARVTCEMLAEALAEVAGWRLLEADVIDGHAFVVWEKTGDARQVRLPWRKQPKHVLVARTGALGDALMAASVLPGLKAQGWAISFISKLPGVTVLRHDPHIDELILLAEGQVDEAELPYYWAAWASRFDRFINLTHAVEGELLKHPGRADYWWSDEQRRALCGQSYLARQHKLADVAGPYRVKFYASDAEEKWARAFAVETGPFVLWCLKGSAVHKWWPYMPEAICRLLARSDLSFVLSGDGDAAPLADAVTDAAQKYFGGTARVRNCAGQFGVREMMVLARHAAVVVGPETGVMHAVCLEPVAKVLLLSHSSRKNLSDDWMNVTALAPAVGCYPCHRLHYGHEWCPSDAATGAAVCAAGISANAVVEAVLRAISASDAPPSLGKKLDDGCRS